MKSSKPLWALDRAEVKGGMRGHTRTLRSTARQSRVLDIRSRSYFLVHSPTGLRGEGEMPEGHYSRGEMTRLTEELRERLFRDLEAQVARLLQIPGR